MDDDVVEVDGGSVVGSDSLGFTKKKNKEIETKGLFFILPRVLGVLGMWFLGLNDLIDCGSYLLLFDVCFIKIWLDMGF